MVHQPEKGRRLISVGDNREMKYASELARAEIELDHWLYFLGEDE